MKKKTKKKRKRTDSTFLKCLKKATCIVRMTMMKKHLQVKREKKQMVFDQS